MNSSLPAQISKAKTQLRFDCVQIAADCVFKGDKGNYSQNDPKDAVNLYRLSKTVV
jgi:dTDP-4-dehydrorhamnose reductase